MDDPDSPTKQLSESQSPVKSAQEVEPEQN